ncbi:Thermostable beta-glucosidase B [compost metagenome]
MTNKGDKAGKEVVQLYISAPTNNLKKPLKELKGFIKTKLLQPGEKETLSFTITAADLASYYTDKSSWIADGGNYTIHIATSSKDIKKSVSFKVANDIVVKKLSHKLPLKEELKELE